LISTKILLISTN